MTTNKIAIKEEAVLLPQEIVETATIQAKLLMDIVEKTKCFQEISGNKYLQVEAWETIGAFNQTHAETESITPILRDKETIGYQAHVQLWKNGQVVGGAVMPCYFTENCCKGKEGDAKHKASMSAAQTFATSKAYRMNYSYVAILAGYQPMPAEEITDDMKSEGQPQGEHWCKEHNTAFFMRGKMKSYAHPVKDEHGNQVKDENGKPVWCHEHKAQVDTSTGEIIVNVDAIDMDWLKESLHTLHWTGVLQYLRDTYHVEGNTVAALVSLLSPEQAKEFAREVQDRLGMR